MDKVFDGEYEFPGLHARQVCVCRLRVYREEPWKGVIVVATELATNPGASITNAIEGLTGRVWRDFTPNAGHPPMVFDHYDSTSYDGGRPPGDFFSLVAFGRAQAETQQVLVPDWQWWPGVMVRRLTADPQCGDGFERDLRLGEEVDY